MEEATKVTSLSELRQVQGAPEAKMPVVHMGYGSLQGFELMQRAAKAFASSSLVPQQFQGNVPNCMIALEMANRMGASPLMVAQNLYIVHGRPGWSAQFLIATFNNNGRFSALRYEFFGDRGKDTWGCRAWAVEKATGEKLAGADVTISLAKAEGWHDKSGSKWKTMPQQMLMYRAASWFIRAYAPEIAMGLHTVDELGDTYDAAMAPDGTFQVDSDTLKQDQAGAGGARKPADIVDASIIDKETGEITGKGSSGDTAGIAQPQQSAQQPEQPAHQPKGPPKFTMRDVIGLVKKGEYGEARELVNDVKGQPHFTDNDRAECEAMVRRHEAGEKV